MPNATRVLAFLIFSGVLLCLILLKPDLTEAPPPTDLVNAQYVQQFVSQWQGSLKSEDTLEGLNEKDKVRAKMSSPAGDTCFMRHRRLFSEYIKRKPQIRRLFQLATLTNTFEDRERLLKRILQNDPDSDLLRFRVYWELSMSSFRSNNRQAVANREKYARMALNALPPTNRCRCDAYYLLGVHNEKQGLTEEAIALQKKAIELDPLFLSARWALIRLLCGKLGQQSEKNIFKRQEMLREVLINLGACADLTHLQGDFIRLGNSLRRYASLSPEVSLAAGYCYYHGGEFQLARRHLKNALLASSTIRKESRLLAEKLLESIKKKKQG